MRLEYDYLLLFLTFAIMAGHLASSLFGVQLGRGAAVGAIGAALAVGTFLSTAAGTGLQIRRPLALQSSGLVVTAGTAVLATIFLNLPMLVLLALVTAVFSGIAKLAVDASIQERVPERLRATAFSHSETVLMLAWVAGGGIGIIPFAGRLGVGLAAVLAVAAAGRAAYAAARLRNERLNGRPAPDPDGPLPDPPDATGTRPSTGGTRPSATGTRPSATGTRPSAGVADDRLPGEPADPWPDAPTVPDDRPAPPPRRPPGSSITRQPGSGAGQPGAGTARQPGSGAARSGATSGRSRAGDETTARQALDPTLVDNGEAGPTKGRRWWQGRGRAGRPPSGERRPQRSHEDSPPPAPAEEEAAPPPGYHVYRPSSAGSTPGDDDPRQ